MMGLRRFEEEGSWTPKQLSGQLLYFLSWVAMTAIAAFLHPDPHGHGTHQQLGLAPCPSVMIWGRPCPGCGLTTCVVALVHGDFASAWAAHPVGVLLYLGFALTALWAGHRYYRRIRIRSEDRVLNWLAIAAVGSVLVFGAVRFASSPNYASMQELAYGLPKP
jgi:hypothetical protein